MMSYGWLRVHATASFTERNYVSLDATASRSFAASRRLFAGSWRELVAERGHAAVIKRDVERVPAAASQIVEREPQVPGFAGIEKAAHRGPSG